MTMEQNSDMPRIGREPTPAENTMTLLRENAAVRAHAAFNWWSSRRSDLLPSAARDAWSMLTDEARRSYEDEMMADLAIYHAMSPAEKELYNRGALKSLLDQNDAAAVLIPPPQPPARGNR